jgi:hypothetical protein
MGNALSEEEEEQLLEEAYTMSLESPEADRYLNAGTAAPNCQPKHTKDKPGEEIEEGQEVVIKDKDKGAAVEDGKGPSSKHRRGSSNSDSDQDERRKRQHTNNSQQQKKLSYFQMARLGYQELVNAIIRPPRADYKVRIILVPRFCSKHMSLHLRSHFFCVSFSPQRF